MLDDVTENHPAPPSNIGSSKRWNIPGDVIMRATSDLPDDQRAVLRWLGEHAAELNYTTAEIGAKLRRPDGSAYDGNTVYKILTGRHEAKLDNFITAVEEYKELALSRSTIRKSGFIETSLSKKINQVCETALLFQRVAFIIGESQIGKTSSLLHVQQTRPHGSVFYVRVPSGGAYADFLSEIAVAMRIPHYINRQQLRARIKAALDDRTLLIIDEAHQVFLNRDGVCGLKLIEFLRELHDESKCGLVICGTKVFANEMQQGRHAKFLQQLDLRQICKLSLPDRPPKADLDTFARAYGLPPARSGEEALLQKEIVSAYGLGRWLVLLQLGTRIASKAKDTFTWKHVIKAHAGLLDLENPKQETL